MDVNLSSDHSESEMESSVMENVEDDDDEGEESSYDKSMRSELEDKIIALYKRGINKPWTKRKK